MHARRERIHDARERIVAEGSHPQRRRFWSAVQAGKESEPPVLGGSRSRQPRPTLASSRPDALNNALAFLSQNRANSKERCHGSRFSPEPRLGPGWAAQNGGLERQAGIGPDRPIIKGVR
eukprot:350468-Chlamydomonas_euryale.AAC.12